MRAAIGVQNSVLVVSSERRRDVAIGSSATVDAVLKEFKAPQGYKPFMAGKEVPPTTVLKGGERIDLEPVPPPAA